MNFNDYSVYSPDPVSQAHEFGHYLIGIRPPSYKKINLI